MAMMQMPERRGGDRKSKDQSAVSRHNGKSRDDLAKAFKVGKESIQQAKALLTEAPDLAVKVECCTAH
jgi:hypothetical protein